MVKKLIKIMMIIAFTATNANSELCKDFMIWDGSEPVRDYGIDSTGNWWAMTAPFNSFYRLIVNGDDTEDFNLIYKPIFSQDGNRWAAFAEAGGTWYIITNDDLIELKATGVGNLGFTQDNKTLVYSYFVAGIEYIKMGSKTIEVVGKAGTFFTNFNGSMFAFTGMRGDKKVLNINGKETTTYDEILPIGFWQDNQFLYAAKNGNSWRFYRDFRAFTEDFNNVKESAINHRGTVAAALVETTAGFQTGITFSDEYYEPLFGRNYDIVGYLTLHPELPLISYYARSGIGSMIVMNTAEYSTYQNTGMPRFSHDGDDLLFAACDFDCFININGRRFPLKSNLSPQTHFALKPGSNTIAYSTNATIVLMFLEKGNMHAGMMVDRIIAPIFNRKTNRYETIGEINNRLYLLTCKPN